MVMYHNGTDNFLKNPNGTFKIFTGADKQSILAVPDAEVSLHYNDGKKLETTNTGVTVTGTCTATAFSGDGSALTGITSFVSGMIILWSGAANAIPTGWVLCDGNNSTPNLTERFVVGAGGTGNASVSGSSAYSVGDTGGNVTVNSGAGNSFGTALNWPAGSPNELGVNNRGHVHPVDVLPPYYALCYIMKT